MKPNTGRALFMLAAIFLSALVGRADETSYANILQERASVLSQIVAEREAGYATGTGSEEAIAAARVALYSFRRDVAATSAEKINNQELIVRVFEKILETLQAKMRSGVGGNIQVLEAKASLLEAKQILAELRLRPKNG